MLDIILIAIGMLGLLVSSITDIKTYEVPDWISYSMIASGLGIRLVYSIIEASWYYFLYGLLGFGIMFVFGNLMYYTKQWGGGDSKLMMGLGALFATSDLYKNFLFGIIINILIIGAVYGLVYGTVLALKNQKKFLKEIKKGLINQKKSRILFLLTALLFLLFSFVVKDNFLKLMMYFIAVILILYHYLIITVKAIENVCMFKEIPISKLTEGDWVVNDLYSGKRLIYSSKSLGIEKNQIEKIKRLKIKKILVKYGIPFVPSFLIGFIATLIFGNILF
ncbi:prepilin peptidase, partial [Candidatus Woesearchaeota archaeon]|nr:prepilin peptidase [Candidatus Woesearchaeota archaeon]